MKSARPKSKKKSGSPGFFGSMGKHLKKMVNFGGSEDSEETQDNVLSGATAGPSKPKQVCLVL